MLKSHPDNFKLDYALSREQKNKDGGKMYIQDKVAEYADEVFTRMDNVRPPRDTRTPTLSCGTHGMPPSRTRARASLPAPCPRIAAAPRTVPAA